MSPMSKPSGRRSGSDLPSDDGGHHHLTHSDTVTSSDGQPAHSSRTGSSGSFSRLFGSFGSSCTDPFPLSCQPPPSADGSFGAASEPSVSNSRLATPFRSRASSAIASKTPIGRVRTHYRTISLPTAVIFKPTRSVSDSTGSQYPAARSVTVELDTAEERTPFAYPSPILTPPSSSQSPLSARSPAGQQSVSDFNWFFESPSGERSPAAASSPDDQPPSPPFPLSLSDTNTEAGDASGRVLSKATDLRPLFGRGRYGRKSQKKFDKQAYPKPTWVDVLEKDETNKLTKFWDLSEKQARKARKEAEERELSINDFLNSAPPPNTPGFHLRLPSISESSNEVVGALPRFKMNSSLLTLGSRDLADEKDKQRRIKDAQEMFASISRKAERTNTPMPPYEFLELIGKGAFGRVYKAIDKRTGDLVAIKITHVDDEFGFEETVRDFQKEVSILQQLKSNNIKNVNVIHDAFDLHSQLWIVADYCTGGSIRTLLRAWEINGKQYGLPEKYIIPIARELAIALKGMHSMKIIHRDIKGANVYITEKGDIQLGDFGIVGVIDDGNSKRKTVIGTPQYMSKELITKLDTDEQFKEGYGTEVDIWAYGCTIYEMATGSAPFAHLSSPAAIAKAVETNGPPRLKGAEYSTELCDLIAYCVKVDMKARPSADDILKHPFIANTTKHYPTSGLVKLIERYKIWEHGGGSRASLWMAAPSDAAKPAEEEEEDADKPRNDVDDDVDGWNFSTSDDFNKRVSQMPGLQEGDLSYLQAPEGSGLPPGLPPLNTKDISVAERIKREHSELSANRGELSLARVFNTSDEAGYQLTGAALEETPPPALAPPPSDLPLRNFTGNAPTRESMIEIDLDEGVPDETATSTFAMHMGMNDNTIKPTPRKFALDDEEDDEFQFNEQEDASRRDTMAWTFPSASNADPPPTSPKPENPQLKRGTMEWSFATAQTRRSTERDTIMDAPNFGGGDGLPPGFRPGLKHTSTEPIGHFRDFSHDSSASAPSPARQSVTSMIDLDMGLVDPPRHLDDPAEIVRPSTASSAAGSTMTDMTSGNPFDLEDDPIQNELDRNRFSYHKQWQSETLRRKRDSRKGMDMHARGISLSSTGSGMDNHMTSSTPGLADLMAPSEVFESDMNLQQSEEANQQWPNFPAYEGGFDTGPNYLPTFGEMSRMTEGFPQDNALRANGHSFRSREPSTEPPGPEVDFPDIVAPDPNALHEDADPRHLEDELGNTLNDLATALSGMEASLKQYANFDANDFDDETSDVESGFESAKETEDEGTGETLLTARRNPPRSRSPGGE